jgi:hypothetical protein
LRVSMTAHGGCASAAAGLAESSRSLTGLLQLLRVMESSLMVALLSSEE